jgi:hypothetical protein
MEGSKCESFELAERVSFVLGYVSRLHTLLYSIYRADILSNPHEHTYTVQHHPNPKEDPSGQSSKIGKRGPENDAIHVAPLCLSTVFWRERVYSISRQTADEARRPRLVQLLDSTIGPSASRVAVSSRPIPLGRAHTCSVAESRQTCTTRTVSRAREGQHDQWLRIDTPSTRRTRSVDTKLSTGGILPCGRSGWSDARLTTDVRAENGRTQGNTR